jgi:ubiquitin carboxyl-terminal hydrolase L5
VLKGVIAEKLKEGPEAYKLWIEDAKNKTKQRTEEQRKKQGDDDAEMAA